MPRIAGRFAARNRCAEKRVGIRQKDLAPET
jgi:hypothetical protein